MDRGGGLDRLAGSLESNPASGESRERKSEEAEVQKFLHRRRIDDRHHGGFEHLLALMRRRRRLGAVVVARNRQHAAVRRGTGPIGMPQCVGRTVDAGPFAVPDAEYAIDFGARKQPDLLAAPYRGCGKVHVEAGLEADIMLLKEAPRLPERVVVAAEWRAAIA